MKSRRIPADLLDAESSREQKSCSAQNQQTEILLFSHGNRTSRKRESILSQAPHQIQRLSWHGEPCGLGVRSFYWPRLVPVSRVVGLDSALIPLPPLTSFTGCRSRIMASLIFFLSRRQRDRTSLAFRSFVLMRKQLFPIISWQRF
jgi:hypothetical protein